MMNHVCKVVVVEDEPLMLENTVQKVEKADPFFKVIGSAFNGLEACSLIDAVRPDLLITDIKMPVMDGLDLIKNVKVKYPETQVVVLSGYDEFNYAQQAIKCGVKDYLLKPLTLDSLTKSLQTIHAEIEIKAAEKIKSLLLALLNGLPVAAPDVEIVKDNNFMIMLICIGNLCHESANIESLPYGQVVNRLPWPKMLNAFPSRVTGWWVCDAAGSSNEKFVIIGLENDVNLGLDPAGLAETLKIELWKQTQPTPVTVCTNGNSVLITDIKRESIKMHAALNQRLLFGKSSVINLAAPNDAFLPSPLITQMTEAKLAAAVQNGNKKFLYDEIRDLFKQWDMGRYPQKWLEEIILQLIKILQRQVIQPATKDNFYGLESDLCKNLAAAGNLEEYFQFFWEAFENILFPSDEAHEPSRELIKKVAEYIAKNYCQPMTIESIAKRFSFDPSYFTRAFKKHQGCSPLKYIMRLKIAEAQKLIKERPDLDLKEISEIIGYQDSHYFSRIFRHITGKSPSEYKESVSVNKPCEMTRTESYF